MEKQVYLIIDAKIPFEELKKKLEKALPYLSKIQFYNTADLSNEYLFELLDWFTQHCKDCFVYENKKALSLHPNLGIHLDEVEDLSELEIKLNRKIKKGVTIGNDLEKVKKAEDLKYNYISFCSVFPSKSANTCELVNFETIKKARNIFSNQIFLAGGITPKTKQQLKEFDYDGVAVISIVMDNENPLEIINKLK